MSESQDELFSIFKGEQILRVYRHNVEKIFSDSRFRNSVFEKITCFEILLKKHSVIRFIANS